MGTISLILLVFAFVCFVIAAFWNPPSPPRVLLGWFGLACWVLAEILGRAFH
jgi:Na+/H+ antiporter NhaC